MSAQQFRGQVKTVACAVLVQVAQDVGQLQRLAQGMRQTVAGFGIETEDAIRQAADGAGDPVAIGRQPGEVGDPNAVGRVHLHAVDDGDKILAPEAEPGDRRGQRARHRLARPAGVQAVDFLAPFLKPQALVFGVAGFVGDVVDLAAERVDGVHGPALFRRQQAHRPVERGSRAANQPFDMLGHRRAGLYCRSSVHTRGLPPLEQMLLHQRRQRVTGAGRHRLAGP